MENNSKEIIISAISFVKSELLNTSSSSSSEDELAILIERKPYHRIPNFLEDVVHKYSEQEVILNILYIKQLLICFSYYSLK